MKIDEDDTHTDYLDEQFLVSDVSGKQNSLHFSSDYNQQVSSIVQFVDNSESDEYDSYE